MAKNRYFVTIIRFRSGKYRHIYPLKIAFFNMASKKNALFSWEEFGNLIK